MTLFFHLFKVQNNVKSTNGLGIFSLRKNVKYFETYSNNVIHFKDHFFLVAPLNEEAHANIFRLEPGFSSTCMDSLCKYWTQSHFLVRVGMYRYR